MPYRADDPKNTCDPVTRKVGVDALIDPNRLTNCPFLEAQLLRPALKICHRHIFLTLRGAPAGGGGIVYFEGGIVWKKKTRGEEDDLL